MPLYEYECDNHGHRFEVIVKFSDPPVEKCPQCGGPVHKLMSAPAFQLKGTGWYVTDYAKKGETKDTAETKGSTEAAGGKESPESKKSDESKAEKTSSKDTASASKPSTGTSTSETSSAKD
jgi:putative FmdB family regulatory protein